MKWSKLAYPLMSAATGAIDWLSSKKTPDSHPLPTAAFGPQKKLPKIIAYSVISLLTLAAMLMAPCKTFALTGADIGLYVDYGVWSEGATAIKNMCGAFGLTVEEVSAQDLNLGSQSLSGLYKVFLVPGGYAPYYNQSVNSGGKAKIRDFVSAGGGYLGICAGAYFAADLVQGGDAYGHLEPYDDAAGYDLDLFFGAASGPVFEIANFYDPVKPYAMTTITYNSDNSVLTDYHPAGNSDSVLYYGGPLLDPHPGSSNFEILAWFNVVSKPALVSCYYGAGRVILSSGHPEIEEDSDADGVTLAFESSFDDKGSDWELVLHLLNWLMKDTSQADRDGDSLPDTWEVRWFGGIKRYGAVDDPDNDGVSNYQEYLAKTDPTKGAGYPLRNATVVSGDWKYLDWFGYFSDKDFTQASPWIYHQQHGYMYMSGTDESNIGFWNSGLGWIWTNSSTYPGLYRLSDGAWIRYWMGTANPRWFYNYQTGGWEIY